MGGMRKNFMGMDGFVWWMGVVENRLDPKKVGRVQVRIFGLHTDDMSYIPREDLPWAQPMISVNNQMTSTPKEGDMVVGFFFDGDACQYPMIMGIVPGIPEQTPPISKGFSDPRTDFSKYPAEGKDALSNRYPYRLNESTLSRVARNENLDNTVIRTMLDNQVGPEPKTAYAVQYPFDNVMESESGHVFELDDTPGAERVNLAHRSGSYIEMAPDGSTTHKVIANNFQVIISNDNVWIGGNCVVQIGGDATVVVGGKIEITAGQSVQITAPGGLSVLGGSLYVEGAISSAVGATGSHSTPNGDVVNYVNGMVI